MRDISAPALIDSLNMIVMGETNKEIARDLDITEATVKVHIKTVLRKLDLSNRTQAAVWAVNKGLATTRVSRSLHLLCRFA